MISGLIIQRKTIILKYLSTLKNLRQLFFFSIILILPSTISINAQSKVQRMVMDGLDYSYNFQWQQANDIFQKLIKQNPEDARGYHYESSIYLWYYLSNKDKNDLNTFIAYSDTAIDKAKDQLSTKPEDTNILYILGANYTLRAIVFSKAEKFLDAAWATKKAESYLNQALQIDSTKYDAYLGLGLYNFAVGQIPSGYKWALSLAGISGNKEVGIKYIKIAATKGNLSKVEAQYYYAEILSGFLEDYKTAEEYSKELVKRFPNNLLFNYSYAVIEIKSKKLDNAEKILSRTLKTNKPRFLQLIAYSDFLMGDVFFKKNEFDSAKTYYLNFLNTTLDDSYTGIANYRLGVCYEISGNREAAIRHYLLTNKGNMDVDDDIYAERKGKELVSDSLTKNEIALIKFSNLIDDAKYKAAFDSLSVLLPELEENDLKAETYLKLSEAAFGAGKFQKSSDFALTATNLNIQDEKWVKPFAFYFAAKAQKKLGNTQAMTNLIDQAEDFSNYDYQNKLKNLLFSLSNKI